VGALESAVVVGGVSAIGGGLMSLGIPKDSILKYETALKTDKYVIVAHGDAEQIHHARAILDDTAAESVEHHEPATGAIALQTS